MNNEYVNVILNSDFSENIAYNQPDFPAYIKKGQLSRYPDFRAVSHWHDDFEFVLILDGNMSYNVNGNHLLLQTGDGLFVNSRSFHYGYSDAHTDCSFICIILSAELLSANEYFKTNCINPLMQNSKFPFQKLASTIPWQNNILNDISELYTVNCNKLCPFHIIQKFAHILDILFQNMNSSPAYEQDNEDIQAITAMIGFVQKHYQDKIILKDISDVGNCGKTKCTALFQKYLSMSPIAFLNHYRLKKASLLLRSTSMSITEISYTCGFSGTSYFCELFHKYYDITPGAYRSRKTPDKLSIPTQTVPSAPPLP